MLPDGQSLAFPVSPGQQQARHGAWRTDNHPPLRAPIVRQGRGVLYELEAQQVHEEPDRWIVLTDHDGDEAQMHRTSIGDLHCSYFEM